MSDPPVALTPESFAERLYLAMAPLARADADSAWSLLILCNAIGTMYQQVEELVRDSPEGPGWSALLDVDRCPPEALPWLAQFVGVRLLPDSSEAEQRARIDSTGGFKRGTRDALIGAAQATLTGRKTVIFRERDHDPADTPAYAYYLTVITYTSETPDSAATLRALQAQKPGGIVLSYRTASGQDYTQLKTGNATYTAVKTGYADYTAVRTSEPG
jgi:Phage tail protein (Tail_P2_I)